MLSSTSRRVTAGLPGSGGRLASDPADFEVTEILAYAPSGEGEHLFVEIEKVGLTTFEAVRRLSRAYELETGLALDARDAGFAGMKDRHARARQWVSIPLPLAAAIPRLDRLEGSELRVLQASRHLNKIRRGHQRANRFGITIRSVPSGGIDRAGVALAVLRQSGVPNGFGPQRFGRDGDNAETAIAFVKGHARPPRDRRIRDLLVSALQSAVFNRVLELRIERGLLGAALLGDVMQKHDTGGLFDVSDPQAEQSRADRLEISPTAALPGKRARMASGVPREIEDAALAELGLSAEHFARFADGTRRVLRYPLDPQARVIAAGEDAYRLEVTLPSGAYATVVLDELVKPEDGPFNRSLDAE